jgi:cystathionine beta-lyase/cystathionine gamma-synthase
VLKATLEREGHQREIASAEHEAEMSKRKAETESLEERIAALENGRAAVATSSGMAAQMIAMLNICQTGDEIVAARTLYGGTHTQLDVNFRKLGINTIFVDSDDPENFARAITPKTKLLYAETLGNPSLNVLDIAKVSAIADQAGLPPGPVLCGADLPAQAGAAGESSGPGAALKAPSRLDATPEGLAQVG